MHPYSEPEVMSEVPIQQTIEEFVKSSRLAIEVGFDGVELHMELMAILSINSSIMLLINARMLGEALLARDLSFLCR